MRSWQRVFWAPVVLVFSLFLASSASYAPTAANTSPYDTLLLMRERIKRDLDKAKEIRGKAMLQKSRLEALMEKVRQGAQDPNIDQETFHKILEGAPAGIADAERSLTTTEQTIKDLELKMKWTQRAIDNLDSAMKPEKKYDPANDLGFGMVLQPTLANVQLLRHGQTGTSPLGEGQFLPGDEIVSDKLGHTTVSSLGSANYVIAVGPETRLKLEQDDKTKGTVWSMSEGVIHYSPLGVGSDTLPARMRTPDSIVQGSPDSEFDVRINAKGETSIEVYRGKVEVREPAKGTSYFVDSAKDRPTTDHWWEKE